MQKVFNVAVDIGRKLPAPAFDVNTNDLKSVKLLITITNGQTLLDLTDTTVRIAIRKPDNNIIFQDCTIKDAKTGQVEIILENQAYIMAGTHTAEIMCYKGSDVVAVSGTFSYKSTKGIMNDEAVESKSEFTAINQKIEEAKKLLEDAAESGVGVDEQARQDIQEVTAALAEMPKTVNNIAPDEEGNIQIPVPEIDTSQLATKEELIEKADKNDVKPIYNLPRIPTNTAGFETNSLLLIYENILSWNPSFWEVGSLAGATGLPTDATNRIRTKDFIKVEPNVQYKVFDMTPTSGVGTINIMQYDEAGNFISTTSWQRNEYVLVTSPTTAKIKVLMQNKNSTEITIVEPSTVSKPVITRIY